MFGETTIFYRKNWNHPVETTIYKQMFQLPGKYQPTKITTTFFRRLGLDSVILANQMSHEKNPDMTFHEKYWNRDPDFMVYHNAI